MTRLTFLASALGAAFSAHALDLNGIVLDQPTTRESLQTKLGVECPGLGDARFSCLGKTTIETSPVFVLVEGHDSIPTRIILHFASLEYQVIGVAAKLKWGPPSAHSSVPMENGYGARHDVHVYIWNEKKTGAQAMLSNVSDYGDIDECQLTLQTRAEAAVREPKKGNSL